MPGINFEKNEVLHSLPKQQPPTTDSPCLIDQVYSTYNPKQGTEYLQFRPDYDPSLYQAVRDHHVSTGGKCDTLLDVGCGPGTVTRVIGRNFTHIIGIDPSSAMVNIARSGITESTSTSQFEVSTAESLGANLSPSIPDESVDLITAANAAHWFNMPDFWGSAARVLRPGGTVAIWASPMQRIHPSNSNSVAIQAAMDEYKARYFEAYLEPGDRLIQDCYHELPLPWTLNCPVADFEKDSFVQKEWESVDGPMAIPQEFSVAAFGRFLGTMGYVTQWREAHKEAVGTEDDVVVALCRKIESLLHAAGQRKGAETVRLAMEGSLLMVKKRKV